MKIFWSTLKEWVRQNKIKSVLGVIFLSVLASQASDLVTYIRGKAWQSIRQDTDSAPSLKPAEPPKLEPHPTTKEIETQHGWTKGVHGEKIEAWQFQTSVLIKNPTPSPADNALIRTCFFTGRGWTSEISEWKPICLKQSPPSTIYNISATGEIRTHPTASGGHDLPEEVLPEKDAPGWPFGLAPKIETYPQATGDVTQYPVAHGPARTIGYGGCSAWRCFPEPTRRFKAYSQFEHWLTPQLADDPSKYLCDGSATAVLLVVLIWEDQAGSRSQPHTHYLPVQCVTDPNPIPGQPSEKIFRWADELLAQPPPGIDPPQECISPFSKKLSQ